MLAFKTSQVMSSSSPNVFEADANAPFHVNISGSVVDEMARRFGTTMLL